MNLPPFLLLQEHPNFSKASFLFFTLVLKLFSFLHYTFFLFISASFFPVNTKICSIFYHFLKHLPSFPQFPCSYYPFLSVFFFFTARFPHLLNSCLFSHSLNCSSLASPTPPSLHIVPLK